MVKKTIATVLVLCAVLMLCPKVFAKSYTDVPKNHDAYEAVDFLSDMGVIAGYGNGEFCPENEITRGEAAALMGRSVGYTDDYEAKKLPFTDVKAGYWAEKFISYCYEKKLINGMTTTTYCPAEKVTYAQIVKMLVCASELEYEVKTNKGEKWYEGYIRVAEVNGIIGGVDIKPDLPAPRGDVAILVYNCFLNDLIEEKKPTPTPTPTPKPTSKPTPEPDDEENEGETSTPTPKPEPFKVDKEDVVYSAKVSDDFEFAKGMNYDIEDMLSDIDFSDLEKISKEDKLLIVIDPGHNFTGSDVGAHNSTYDLWEQNITFPIAEMLRQKLEYMGFEVVMTRDNYNDCVSGNTMKEVLSNRAGIANGLNADLFISIHCNAGGGKGVETYCYQKGTRAESLAKLVQKNLVRETGLVDRGVKTAGFVVIKETVMPAILVETAFIDTESDFKFLTTNDGQNKLSTAIAKGVFEYVTK